MTIGEHLLNVGDAGLALGEVDVDENIFNHLTVLLDIEDTLDQGRVSLALLDSGKEHIPEINKKMDELRKRIRLLIDECDKNEFISFMNNRSDRLKSQFTVTL